MGFSCETSSLAAEAPCCCEADGSGTHEESAPREHEDAPCDCGAPCCGSPALIAGAAPSLPAAMREREPGLPGDGQGVCGLVLDSIFHPPRSV
jgi:hypothetical protein